jgi:hypothetical protein
VLANVCGGSQSCITPEDEIIECKSMADNMDACLAKGTDQVVFFHLEANTIEITHGYADITGMNPPFVGMEWGPFREKPRNDRRRV